MSRHETIARLNPRRLTLENLESRELMAYDLGIPGAAAGTSNPNPYVTVADRVVDRGLINMAEEVVVGDFDGDGRDDVFFRNVESGANRILLSRANGFQAVTNRILPGAINGFDEVYAGDFDGDGRDDLFFREIGSGGNRIMFARGNEQFSMVTNRVAPGWINGAEEAVVGDFDGDRRDDILFRNVRSGDNRILFARGNEQFNPVTNRIPQGWINGFDEVYAADFDGDKRDDLFFRNVGSGDNRILFARGNEQFSMVTNRIPTGWINGAEKLLAGDFNRDGKDDMLFYNPATGSNRMVLAAGNETFREITTAVSPSAINGYDQGIAGDFDGNGAVDLFFRDIESGENRTLFFMLATQGSSSGNSNPAALPPIGFLPPGLG